ncbi:hypothetical protein M8J75_015953 [Diaphorina citri]|nr:hypothetical protein M8J75_015953 [Diaphorina citri]
MHVTYDHRSIHVWYDQNLCQVQPPFQFEDPNSSLLSPHGSATSLLGSSVWRQFSLEGCVELWNVSAVLSLSRDTPKSVIGFNKTKLSMSCEQEHGPEESSPIAQYLPRDLRHRTFHSELLVESVWCSLNIDNIGGAQFLKKCHSWGTALYIGVILIKTKIPRVPNTPKLNAMFDTVRLEWSADLCIFLLEVLNCAKQYKESSNKFNKLKPPSPILKVESKPSYLGSLVSSVHLTNVNLFYISDQMGKIHF